VSAKAAEDQLAEGELRTRVVELVAASQHDKPPSRASLVRERLFEGIRPVRSLLPEIGKLPWQAEADNPVLIAFNQLLKLYADKARELPVEISAPRLGGVWSTAITGEDRDKAMRAMEVATLFSLRRALRNGSIEADIMAKIAPTRLSGINLRGVFRFPVEKYAADLMPSLAPSINAAVG